MSYEKDLDYLKRELRNAQNIYDEAEEDERESDAEMWMNRVTHLEFQIEVFEKAAKADEYEAKAKAFDYIENLVKTELTSDDLYNDARNNDYAAGMLRVYEMVDYIIEEYESGESE